MVKVLFHILKTHWAEILLQDKGKQNKQTNKLEKKKHKKEEEEEEEELKCPLTLSFQVEERQPSPPGKFGAQPTGKGRKIR